MSQTGSGVATAPRANIHRGLLGDTAPVTDPDYTVNPRSGGHTPPPEWG